MSETPLEKLIETLCDPTGLTDAEVREELAADGVDLDAAMARFRPKLDDLMRARAVRLALAAVRDNPPDTESPLPWQQKDRRTVVDADGDFVARCATEADAAHIAAAVNSTPVLAAEVERNHSNLLTQAKRAGLPVEQLKATDLAEHLADRVLELEAVLAAARVAVEKWPHAIHGRIKEGVPGTLYIHGLPQCPATYGRTPCECGADETNAARTAARCAVGLEE